MDKFDKAITDTGPPLHLHQIGCLHLLRIFKTVIISEQVKKELQGFGTWYSLCNEKGISIEQETVTEDEIIEELNRWKGKELHKTDISVLILARRIADPLILTDDLKLRKAIESLGREVIGSVGILIKSYKEKMLTKEELRKSVYMLFNDSSLYLSSAFRGSVLKLVEELEER